MKRVSIILLLALLALIVIAAPVAASSGVAQETQPPTLDAFLQWLISGGGSILAVSWLFERMKWFQNLASESKDYVIFAVSAVVGCGALALVTYVPAAVMAAIAPYFLILASVFVTVFIAKAFHKADKA
jgi:hypothetical protein